MIPGQPGKIGYGHKEPQVCHVPCSLTWTNKVATKRKCFEFCFIVFPSKYNDFICFVFEV